MKKLFTALVMVIGLLGCSADMIKSLVDMPQVRGVQLKSFSAADKRAVFEVALFNPNPFPLPISGLSGAISLNQLAIGSIDAQSDTSLAANAVQAVMIPISLDPNAFVEAAKSVFMQRKASYQFNGGVNTSLGKVPFSTSGDLSVQDILSTLLR